MSDLTIEDYVEDYVMEDGEGGSYTPTRQERAILLDAAHGIFDFCFEDKFKQLRTENAAQAQEIDELKHALELAQQAERMNYDPPNAALSKLIELDKEHDELKARLEELDK